MAAGAAAGFLGVSDSTGVNDSSDFVLFLAAAVEALLLGAGIGAASSESDKTGFLILRTGLSLSSTTGAGDEAGSAALAALPRRGFSAVAGAEAATLAEEAEAVCGAGEETTFSFSAHSLARALCSASLISVLTLLFFLSVVGVALLPSSDLFVYTIVLGD